MAEPCCHCGLENPHTSLVAHHSATIIAITIAFIGSTTSVTIRLLSILLLRYDCCYCCYYFCFGYFWFYALKSQNIVESGHKTMLGPPFQIHFHIPNWFLLCWTFAHFQWFFLRVGQAELLRLLDATVMPGRPGGMSVTSATMMPGRPGGMSITSRATSRESGGIEMSVWTLSAVAAPGVLRCVMFCKGTVLSHFHLFFQLLLHLFSMQGNICDMEIYCSVN